MKKQKGTGDSRRINTVVLGAAHFRMQDVCDRYYAATGIKLNQGNIISECLMAKLPAVTGEPPSTGPRLLSNILEAIGANGHNGHKPRRKPPSTAPPDKKVPRRTG